MTLYSAVDKAVITVWPRVQYYRDLGVLVGEDRTSMLDSERLTREAQEYLDAKNKEAAFRAYWTVPAQFSLIQVDVFGCDAETQAARAAVENIGRVFQWIKAADDYVDEKNGSRYQNLEALHAVLREEKKPETKGERYILEMYKRFGSGIQKVLEEAYKLELVQCDRVSDEQRYTARGEQGKVLAQLEIAIVKEYVVGLPDTMPTFFEQTGIAGQYFDDLKDFELDRKNGHGYKTNMRGKLFSGFAGHLTGAMRVLTAEQARRECAFLALGGLYQVREVIGVQERT